MFKRVEKFSECRGAAFDGHLDSERARAAAFRFRRGHEPEVKQNAGGFCAGLKRFY